MLVAQSVVCKGLPEGALRVCGTGFLVVRKRLFRGMGEAFLYGGKGFMAWLNGVFGVSGM